jgi:hypothetical protein
VPQFAVVRPWSCFVGRQSLDASLLKSGKAVSLEAKTGMATVCVVFSMPYRSLSVGIDLLLYCYYSVILIHSH